MTEQEFEKACLDNGLKKIDKYDSLSCNVFTWFSYEEDAPEIAEYPSIATADNALVRIPENFRYYDCYQDDKSLIIDDDPKYTRVESVEELDKILKELGPKYKEYRKMHRLKKVEAL